MYLDLQFFTRFVNGTKWADLLALFGVMFPCVFVTFPYGAPGSGVVLDCIDS